MRVCPFRRRIFALIIVIFCCSILSVSPLSSLSAEPDGTFKPSSPIMDNEEIRGLLEKTLSSAELEREIGQITLKQQALEKKLTMLGEQAEEKQKDIADNRERAGAVLRSYYVGDRDGLMTAVLSAKSISKLLALYDYYEIVIGREREILSTYEEQYKDLKKTLAAAERSSKELAEIKTALEQQQIRVAALHDDIASGVKDSSDPDRMNALLQEFTLYWENVGLHEVKTYFKALASAMKDLPDFVQSRKGVLERRGMNYHLNLKEEDLNQFLQSKNKLFKEFAFHFNDGFVTAAGKSGQLSMTLTGHYTIQNDPVNALMFNVDRVVFNGLELPDTTRKSLEEEFDLGFYPERVVSFLRASEVNSSEGVLKVKLSLHF